MSGPTHYDVLKLHPGATPEQIRAAYKSLSRKYHPDMNPDDPQATQVMAKINASYDVLSDPGLRASYDATLAPPAKMATVSDLAEADAGTHRFVMPEDETEAPPKKARRPRRPVDPVAEQAKANREFLAAAGKRLFALMMVAAMIILVTARHLPGSSHEWLILRSLRQMFTGL